METKTLNFPGGAVEMPEAATPADVDPALDKARQRVVAQGTIGPVFQVTLVGGIYEDPRLSRESNPYQRYPERSSWTQYEQHQTTDGARYVMQRDAYRWAGEYAFGDWVFGWEGELHGLVEFGRRVEQKLAAADRASMNRGSWNEGD